VVTVSLVVAGRCCHSRLTDSPTHPLTHCPSLADELLLTPHLLVCLFVCLFVLFVLFTDACHFAVVGPSFVRLFVAWFVGLLARCLVRCLVVVVVVLVVLLLCSLWCVDGL